MGTLCRTIFGKLRDKQLSLRCKLNAAFARNESAPTFGGLDNAKQAARKTSQLAKEQNETSSREATSRDQAAQEDNLASSELKNSVKTCQLFRYAKRRELIAIAFGMLAMLYAASWQPLSVFILAIMATLMGQYSKRAHWLRQVQELGSTSAPTLEQGHLVGANGSGLTSSGASSLPPLLGGYFELARPSANFADFQSGNWQQLTTTGLQQEQHLATFISAQPLGSLTGAIFDWASSNPFNLIISSTPISGNSENSVSQVESSTTQQDEIKQAMERVLQLETTRFLRRSFQINGSAFALAISQLLAFFIGMSLIRWAARRQASRVKLLYFNSCLHQEVTWFEAIDSASGSGCSLNGLVEKFEDGIGSKLALLSYFIGHVCLFALTALYQMFSLAAFCMSFVIAVGLLIGYLSELQASAIGQQALFAKRSLQLAEEIIAAVRTVFAFNGQQKEITRYSLSLNPVYLKSLTKHLYTALNTSLSKFSIFACFAIYCFYAERLFPPYSSERLLNKSIVLAVMRGAEVSIVNILISIPFVEALQQSKGSIARIFVAIERQSRISALARDGLRPTLVGNAGESVGEQSKSATGDEQGAQQEGRWRPTISFRMVQFSYAGRSGPTRRRSTLPYLNLPGGGSGSGCGSGRASGSGSGDLQQSAQSGRRKSLIDELADETLEAGGEQSTQMASNEAKRNSAHIRRALKRELQRSRQPQQTLKNFNLDIEAGQSVALVGHSGSGKSTVLALVQRLYDITGGRLLLGGHDIGELSVAWLRNQIGVVGQEPRLFDLSIGENIALGLPTLSEQEIISEKDCNLKLELINKKSSIELGACSERVLEAARAAGAHQFIVRLPQGYETRVGGSGGVQLSGGQKQRIAIARALIRRPNILLLDECTSALDTESEAQVHSALRALNLDANQRPTTLIVAHRLETIRQVDKIVVMHEGQVVACGTHDELLAEGARQSTEANQGAAIYLRLYEEQLRAHSAKGAQIGLNLQKTENKTNHLEDQSGKLTCFKQQQLDDEVHLKLEHNSDEDDDQEEDDDQSSLSNSESTIASRKPNAWQLWQFVEMPKWSASIAVLVCLLAGLILPLNLVAHSYLFSVFAYSELEQIGAYLHLFGLVTLSFSSFVFVVSFLQVIMPGLVGEKLSVRLRVKTMVSLLQKPMFYFDIRTNSAGALCDRFNGYIGHLQSIAGARLSVMLEACSTLAAGAIFGLGQNLQLSLFCLSFALIVLLTTIIESRLVERECSLEQSYDAQLAHLMADALANMKTIASLNREHYFIQRFSRLLELRERGCGAAWRLAHTFLTSLKFVMPAISWSSSMYFGSWLLASGRIDLQTIYIVCPVVLFAVNDTFRALVFLPELLRARKSIGRLFKMNREFSPQALSALTFAQQLDEQARLHLEQTVGAPSGGGGSFASKKQEETGSRRASSTLVSVGDCLEWAPKIARKRTHHERHAKLMTPDEGGAHERKRSRVSFALDNSLSVDNCVSNDDKRRASALSSLPSYMRRKSSRLNSLVPRCCARGRIQFKDVEFAYPSRPGALVLDQFTLSIEPGESVALVGCSGSGKSTTIALLEKFYDFHGGSLTLDGRDLRLVDANWVRSQIGLVQQEPCLLSYTIGDNIRYGDNARFVTMDEVIEAARLANIHDFIMSLPDAYDTQLSSSAYSSSCQLSGGQRQRIAIARALVRKAPILVFDEATSALDNASEQIVQDALDKAKQGRTSVTIAHRLASCKSAHKIAVLREGRVAELGRHDELLARNPISLYRKLWERQEATGAAAET